MFLHRYDPDGWNGLGKGWYLDINQPPLPINFVIKDLITFSKSGISTNVQYQCNKDQ